jgi:GxxExxY protein
LDKQKKNEIEEDAKTVVDAALQVHRVLGPGLLENAYQQCLAYELKKRGLGVACEVVLPVYYDGQEIDTGYRLDMLVNNHIVIENKAIDGLAPIHTAQVITYLKLSNLNLAFLINWNVTLIKNGIHRIVLNYQGKTTSYLTRLRT